MAAAMSTKPFQRTAGPVSIYLSDALSKQIDVACHRRGCTRSAYIREAIEFYLQPAEPLVQNPNRVP